MLKNEKKLTKLRIKIKKNKNFLKIQSNFLIFQNFELKKFFENSKKSYGASPMGF